jgi:hypothetical protein
MSFLKTEPTLETNYSAIPIEEGGEPTLLEAVRVDSLFEHHPAVGAAAAEVEQVLLVAPANLPGGYEFAANVNGNPITVKVVSQRNELHYRRITRSQERPI